MVGTVEDALTRKTEIERFEEMSPMDRDICQADTAKHLIIPMCDIYNLRRIAGLLHGLAADLDQLSRRHDIRARVIILETRAVIDDTNRRIREMTGKGKRKKPWERVEN